MGTQDDNPVSLEALKSEIEFCVRVQGDCLRYRRWINSVDAAIAQLRKFTETPRCPSCGTSVEPELMLLTNIDSDDTMVYECPACQHEGPQANNEQDALKAFYGEAI